MVDWIQSKLIPEWRTWYKFWTVKLQWLILCICALYPYVPFLQTYAPGWWVAPIAVLTIIVRIIQQKPAE